MGALTAAYFLTDPAAEDQFDVTVYTMGWRLGGKGASGRNQATETIGSRSMASTSGSARTTTRSL